jgi:prefoldin subunit 5
MSILFREDVQKVIVKIGKEYFVELSQEEALQYIGKKEVVLNKRGDLLADQAA